MLRATNTHEENIQSTHASRQRRPEEELEGFARRVERSRRTGSEHVHVCSLHVRRLGENESEWRKRRGEKVVYLYTLQGLVLG